MTADHAFQNLSKTTLNGHAQEETITSPLSGGAMRLLHSIPGDWRRPNDGTTYRLFWNEDDQFGFLTPRPKPEDAHILYDVDGYYTHEETDGWDALPQKPSFMKWLIKRLAWQRDASVYMDHDPHWFNQHHGASPKRVLDIGCGRGKILTILQKAGHNVVGVEMDPKAREIALGLGLDVRDGVAESLPQNLMDQSFDAVIMTHVLEHTTDPIIALKNAVSALKPGGKITIEVPNNNALSFQEAGIVWRWLDVPRHLNFFTPKSLRTLCQMVELKPLVTEFRGYSRQFEREWLREEQQIWERYKAMVGENDGMGSRPSDIQAWQLLRKTLFASDERRYDSVRVIAQKPETSP